MKNYTYKTIVNDDGRRYAVRVDHNGETTIIWNVIEICREYCEETGENSIMVISHDDHWDEDTTDFFWNGETLQVYEDLGVGGEQFYCTVKVPGRHHVTLRKRQRVNA